MTSTDDEVTEIIAELRRDWELTHYAGAGEEREAARAEVIAEAMRLLPECVPVDRRGWGWINTWAVSGAGEAPGFQLDGGIKLQGRSSSMRLLGWPAAIFSSVSLSQA